MASSTSTVKVVILGDSASAQRAATAVNGAFQGMEGKLATVSTKLKTLGSGMRRFGGDMTRYVTAPLIAAGVLAVNEFSELQKVTGQTEAAIKSTGGAANVTATHVKVLADRIGTLSAVEDDQVHSAENVLLTFTKIRNEVGEGNKIFDKATLAVANLSARMDQDLKSSAVQIGKALNDPVKGLTSLTRVGVAFTDSQKEMIARLVESGDVMGAQKIILAELNKEFGGSARAAGEAASPFTRLALIGKDLAETIGAAIMPALQSFAEWVGMLAEKFQALSPTAQKFIVIGAAIAAALGPLIIILGGVATAIGAILSPVGLVVAAIAAFVGALIYAYNRSETFRDIVSDAFEFIKKVAKDVWPEIKETISLALELIGKVISKFVETATRFWKQYGDDIIRLVKTVWPHVKDTIKNVLDVIQGIIKFVMALIDGDWKKAWRAIKEVASALWDQISNVIDLALKLINDVIIPAAVKVIKKLWSEAWEWVKEKASEAWAAIKERIGDAIDRIKERIADGIERMKERVRDGFGRIVDFVKELPGKIISALANFGRLLYDKGRDLVQGLIDGIESMIGNLMSTLGGLAGDVGRAIGGAINPLSKAAVDINVPAVRHLSAVPALASSGSSGGYRTANITVVLDGRQIAAAIAQPLADTIYARTGIRS